MKKVIMLVTLLSYSLSVLSAPLTNEKVEPHWEVKEKITSNPESLAIINNISKATINIGVASNCSGVFISKYGHLVTALHCLNDIFDQVDGEDLLIGMRTKSGLIIKSNQKFEGHSIKVAPLIIGENFLNKTEVPVKVILLGKAFPQRVPDNSASEEEFKIYKDLMEDFAIIKFDKLPSSAECVKIATRSQIENLNSHKIWHTGFPTVKTLQLLNYKDNEFNIRLDKEAELGTPWALDAVFPQYISSGRLYRNYNELLSSIPDIGGVPDISNKILDQNIYLSTSAPILGGFSGGGAFSEDGLLIGVNSMMGLSFPTKYEASGIPDKKVIRKVNDFGYGVSILNIDHIAEKVLQTKGKESAEEIFSCD